MVILLCNWLLVWLQLGSNQLFNQVDYICRSLFLHSCTESIGIIFGCTGILDLVTLYSTHSVLLIPVILVSSIMFSTGYSGKQCQNTQVNHNIGNGYTWQLTIYWYTGNNFWILYTSSIMGNGDSIAFGSILVCPNNGIPSFSMHPVLLEMFV